MKLLSWNVNGVRAAERKGFLDWLQTEQPDILGLQETKAHVSQLSEPLTCPPGYNTYWHLGERKGYSGVALFTKEKPEEVTVHFGDDSLLSQEGRTIQARYKNFTLLNVYFPNGKRGPDRLQFKMDFYKHFLEHVNELRNNGENVIFCGDVNTAHMEIDLARPKANRKISGFLPEERAWIDEVVQHDYIDTFREFNTNPEEYSWWDQKSRARDRNVGWRIDYFFVDKSIRENLKNAFIMQDVMGSDHCPVGIELQT